MPLEGGRTNQVWRIEAPEPSILKVYPPKSDNPMFANDCGDEIRSLACLGQTGLAPHLLASDDAAPPRWIVYRHVAGKPWSRGTADVAQLLARLHGTKAPENLPQNPGGSRALAQQTRTILSQCTSRTARTLERQALPAPVGPVGRLSLIHGDPVPGNILSVPDWLTLIDWQCPAMGDPTEDLSLFMSPAMQSLYRGAPLDTP